MPPPYQAGTSQHLQHLRESVFRILESVGKELPLTSAPITHPPPQLQNSPRKHVACSFVLVDVLFFCFAFVSVLFRVGFVVIYTPHSGGCQIAQ